MASCPECKIEVEANASHCHVCGRGLEPDGLDNWVVLGSVDSQMWAESAKETLKSSGIPAVVISRSGFFGKAGLPLNPIYDSKDSSFEISVPTVHRDEAEEILSVTLGDKWKKKED